MQDDTEYLQIRHAARFAGVGETTVRGWLKRGLLQVREVGGLRLISRSDLVAMLEAHRVPSGPDADPADAIEIRQAG
jgi:excisionase family DNA binding protein